MVLVDTECPAFRMPALFGEPCSWRRWREKSDSELGGATIVTALLLPCVHDFATSHWRLKQLLGVQQTRRHSLSSIILRQTCPMANDEPAGLSDDVRGIDIFSPRHAMYKTTNDRLYSPGLRPPHPPPTPNLRSPRPPHLPPHSPQRPTRSCRDPKADLRPPARHLRPLLAPRPSHGSRVLHPPRLPRGATPGRLARHHARVPREAAHDRRLEGVDQRSGYRRDVSY